MKQNKLTSICVYSPKGGTGKSGIVMSLGGLISKRNKKVLLVDFDLFNGSLCLLINENITKTIYHLTDDFNNNRFKRLEDYTYKFNDNIDILCAPKDPRQGNKIDSKYIEMIIERATSSYDYIVFDTSPELNDINLVTMDNVDEILFVTVNDVMCLKNLRNILNIFKDLNISNYKIILNNFFYKNRFFTNNEIRKIIGDNIDYLLENDFYIKNFNKLLYDNKIAALEKKIEPKSRLELNKLDLIIDELEKQKGVKINEEK